MGRSGFRRIRAPDGKEFSRPGPGATFVPKKSSPHPSGLAVRKIAYPDVLEFHVAPSAGVQLQCNFAVEGGWLGIGEVHHGHAVEQRER